MNGRPKTISEEVGCSQGGLAIDVKVISMLFQGYSHPPLTLYWKMTKLILMYDASEKPM